MKTLIGFLFIVPLIAFGSPITYSCNYPIYSDENGRHKVKEKFELTFLIDGSTGKSYMMGNLGNTEVKLFQNDKNISFVEITTTQNIMTTSVDSKLNSVHSRNSIIYGELVPSQYYGKCKIK